MLPTEDGSNTTSGDSTSPVSVTAFILNNRTEVQGEKRLVKECTINIQKHCNGNKINSLKFSI